jgi:hypothetical protein
MTISAELIKLSEMLTDLEGDRPSFFAYGDTNQADITQGAWTKQAFNQTLFDSHNAYDTTNYRFVAPVAGLYFIRNCGYFAPIADGYYVNAAIYKNGTIVNMGHLVMAYTTTSSLFCDVVELISLEAGDYIEPYIRHQNNAVATLYTSSLSYNHLFGFRIST